VFQISDVSKSFGGRALFQGVTWQINAGDRWGLVGPNGIGKTTLLKMLAGEEPLEGGSISKQRATRLGYLAQEVRRVESGTVLEQVCDAIPEVGQMEREMRRLEEEMATAPPAKAQELAHVHGELQERFQAIDGFLVETRAKEILGGLGFLPKDHAKRLEELSGGWGMRVSLARLLLSKPDLLLLDEPTNHLDLESVVWLEQFLAEYEGAWVVVSHDRYFLNRMVDGIAELSPGGVNLYPGSYDDYLEEREARLDLLQKQAETQQKKIAETERFIERFRYKATKARQAQSRMKQLSKIERLEAPKRKKRVLRIRLPDPPRSGEVAITLEGAKKSYGETVVYDGQDFEMRRGEKIALVGPNGAGKSTLLKLMAGVTELSGGMRRLGHNVTQYYYAQHQADALDPTQTIVEALREVMPMDPESAVRGILGAFLFSGDDVDKKISVLSGGEKARVALARMLARPSNLLLMDEPTNHLDLASREVLESALGSFTGTVAFISHDRYFINSLATKIVEVRRPDPTKASKVFHYLGDYDYWLWKRAHEVAEEEAAAAARGGNDSAQSANQADYARRKDVRREEEKKKKEIAALEKEIETRESKMKEIDALLADPAVYADAPRCKQLLRDRAVLAEALEPLLEKWTEMAG
jgi:ATP-binding cassette, subfamily F, member 3